MSTARRRPTDRVGTFRRVWTASPNGWAIWGTQNLETSKPYLYTPSLLAWACAAIIVGSPALLPSLALGILGFMADVLCG